MPQCMRCNQLVPPQFIVPIVTAQDPEAIQCLFCDKSIKEITIQKDGRREVYTKEQCVKDYATFLKMLKDKQGVAEALVKGKISLPGEPE